MDPLPHWECIELLSISPCRPEMSLPLFFFPLTLETSISRLPFSQQLLTFMKQLLKVPLVCKLWTDSGESLQPSEGGRMLTGSGHQKRNASAVTGRRQIWWEQTAEPGTLIDPVAPLCNLEKGAPSMCSKQSLLIYKSRMPMIPLDVVLLCSAQPAHLYALQGRKS